jgi:hypothetical protein
MNPSNDSRSRLAVLIIALTFATGIAVGVAGERLLIDRVTSRTAIVRDMSEVLDKLRLDPIQRAQAEAILNRSAPHSRQAMLEVAARLRNISDSVDAELRAVLTPKQRSILDSLRRPLTFVLKQKQPSGVTTVDTVQPPH